MYGPGKSHLTTFRHRSHFPSDDTSAGRHRRGAERQTDKRVHSCVIIPSRRRRTVGPRATALRRSPSLDMAKAFSCISSIHGNPACCTGREPPSGKQARGPSGPSRNRTLPKIAMAPGCPALRACSTIFGLLHIGRTALARHHHAGKLELGFGDTKGGGHLEIDLARLTEIGLYRRPRNP